MSLVDPSTRWWNRSGRRRVIARVCWVVATIMYAITGWALADETAPAPLVPLLSVAGLAIAMAGQFLVLFDSSSDRVDVRVILFPLATVFLAVGLGDTARAVWDDARPRSTSVAFVVVGVAVLAVGDVIRRAGSRNRALRDQVRRTGVVTTGTITRTRSHYVDYSPVTRVTVRFTDDSGQLRWATQTLGGAWQVGARVPVRYSPENLGRRAGVSVGG